MPPEKKTRTGEHFPQTGAAEQRAGFQKPPMQCRHGRTEEPGPGSARLHSGKKHSAPETTAQTRSGTWRSFGGSVRNLILRRTAESRGVFGTVAGCHHRPSDSWKPQAAPCRINMWKTKRCLEQLVRFLQRHLAWTMRGIPAADFYPGTGVTLDKDRGWSTTRGFLSLL